MSNLVKISNQIKKCSTQGLDFEWSVLMTAIYYSGSIWAVPIKEQLLGEKRA